MKLLREFVTRRRNELHLSQQDLARTSGVPAGTIASIEAGRVTRSPRPDTLRRLANGLEVPPEALLQLSGYLTDEVAFLDATRLPEAHSRQWDFLDLRALDQTARLELIGLYTSMLRPVAPIGEKISPVS